MSWESSAEYYRIINEIVKETLGKSHSAKSIMYSVDFEEIERLQKQDEWDDMADILIEAAISLEKAGADFIIIATNTMHKLVSNIEDNIVIPVIHIADPTAIAIKNQEIKKIALLGTKYTMEGDFYRGRLEKHHKLEVIIPDEEDRKIIHDIIYKELIHGKVYVESRDAYKEIIEKLRDMGAEGVILGCTEIGLLIKQKDTSLPVFDTTMIHARTAVELALEEYNT